jgi:hypothetical protein
MKRPNAASRNGFSPTAVLTLGIAVAACLLAVRSPALSATSRRADPDWPCQQVKVAELSVGSFWNGPPVDPAAAWQEDETVAALVATVTQRRVPIETAAAGIADFARAAGDAKNGKLLLLFGGVFDVLDHERLKVIDGLDRFGQRQKALAQALRDSGAVLRAAQTAAQPDDAKVAELTQRLLWDSDVFETRRQSLTFACNVPTAIEQRLFGLSRAIQALLD